MVAVFPAAVAGRLREVCAGLFVRGARLGSARGVVFVVVVVRGLGVGEEGVSWRSAEYGVDGEAGALRAGDCGAGDGEPVRLKGEVRGLLP